MQGNFELAVVGGLENSVGKDFIQARISMIKPGTDDSTCNGLAALKVKEGQGKYGYDGGKQVRYSTDISDLLIGAQTIIECVTE